MVFMTLPGIRAEYHQYWTGSTRGFEVLFKIYAEYHFLWLVLIALKFLPYIRASTTTIT